MSVFLISLVICLQAPVWAAAPHLDALALEQALHNDPNNLQTATDSARLLGSLHYKVLATERWRQVLLLSPGNVEALQAIADLQAAPGAADAPSATAAEVEPSQSIWVDGEIRGSVKTINGFNLSAPQRQRLSQVYIASGQLVLAPGRSRWALDLRPAQMAADTLSGDSRVALWVQVRSRDARNLQAADLDKAAQELAALLKDQKRIAGIVLEPQPASPELLPLYAALRAQVRLPLSVVVSSATPADFAAVDVLILKAWADKEDVATYKTRVSDAIAAFLRAAELGQGHAMVGLSGSLAQGGSATPYFDAGRDAIVKALGTGGNKAFVGIAVRGLLPKDDGTQTDLEPAVWELVKLPVGAP